MAVEMDRLQPLLADCLERNDIVEGLALAEAMLRLKPHDSLAIAARAFICEQLKRSMPVGEYGRLEVLEHPVRCVAFAPDDEHVAAAAGSGIYVWTAPGKQFVSVCEGHYEARCVAFSLDGRRMASGDRDGTLHLWDATTGKHVRSFHEHSDAINAAVFTLSGHILSASDDKPLCLLEPETGHPITRFRGHTSAIHSVVCSHDGKRALSSSSDHTVRLWDLEGGGQLQCLGGGAASFFTAALSPGGRYAIFGGSDNTIYVNSLEKSSQAWSLRGHCDWVSSVACLPDGKRLLSSSHDNTLRLWNIATGEELYRFKVDSKRILSTASSHFPEEATRTFACGDFPSRICPRRGDQYPGGYERVRVYVRDKARRQRETFIPFPYTNGR